MPVLPITIGSLVIDLPAHQTHGFGEHELCRLVMMAIHQPLLAPRSPGRQPSAPFFSRIWSAFKHAFDNLKRPCCVPRHHVCGGCGPGQAEAAAASSVCGALRCELDQQSLCRTACRACWSHCPRSHLQVPCALCVVLASEGINTSSIVWLYLGRSWKAAKMALASASACGPTCYGVVPV